jgi:aminoglycoside 3-N-acetyltransferase
MKQYIRPIVPARLLSVSREFRARRELRLDEERLRRKQSAKRYTEDELVQLFFSLGVRSGDTLFIHSGLGVFNIVEGGPSAIVSSLLRILGADGTLAFPAFSAWGTMMNDRPIFDLKKTVSSVGALAEHFRLMPGVVRSLHPTHSICAIGSKAEWLTEGQESRSFTFGRGTPFYKLCEARAKIMMLGVGLFPLTCVHTAEDLITPTSEYMPVYRKEPLTFDMIDRSGHSCRYHGYFHSHDLVPKRDVRRMRACFMAHNIMTASETDYAELLLIDTQGLLLALLTELMRGNTIYGRVYPTRRDSRKIDVTLTHLKEVCGFSFTSMPKSVSHI